jgi:hypothetical protein
MDKQFVYKREDLERFRNFGKGDFLFGNVFYRRLDEMGILSGKPYNREFTNFGPDFTGRKGHTSGRRKIIQYEIGDGAVLTFDFIISQNADFIVRLEGFDEDSETYRKTAGFLERIEDASELGKEIEAYASMWWD